MAENPPLTFSNSLTIEQLQVIINSYVPEINDLWITRRDDFEEEGIRTGRLHENHILGIILAMFSLNQKNITTQDIENLYELYFKKIARSTVSTYLNQLDKEGVLGKERNGRTVFYYMQEPPPYNVKPFWIIRNFCVLPIYFMRAQYIARFLDMKTNIDPELEDFRKFIIGVTLLTIFRNRFEKCMVCQFASRDGYRELKETFDTIIKDRKDVLPEPLLTFIEKELGEIPVFGGATIPELLSDDALNEKLNDLIERYAQDIDFQINVSKRRQDLRIKQMTPKKA